MIHVKKGIWCTESAHPIATIIKQNQKKKIKADKGLLKVWNNHCMNSDQKENGL